MRERHEAQATRAARRGRAERSHCNDISLGPSKVAGAPVLFVQCILFRNGIDLQTADRDLINKYTIYWFNRYAAENANDYSLWEGIQVDFRKFEAKHFDQLESTTWKLVKDYCYPHGYRIDHSLGPGRTCTDAMLKAVVEVNWNDEWTLKQIRWVEARYDTLFRFTCKRK